MTWGLVIRISWDTGSIHWELKVPLHLTELRYDPFGEGTINVSVGHDVIQNHTQQNIRTKKFNNLLFYNVNFAFQRGFLAITIQNKQHIWIHKTVSLPQPALTPVTALSCCFCFRSVYLVHAHLCLCVSSASVGSSLNTLLTFSE